MTADAQDSPGLGYDPRPSLTHWCGTWIPPVDEPIARTSRRWAIAGGVWFCGPQWSILRNAVYYLWHVMDNGSHEDVLFTIGDIPRRLWLRALREARPGNLSKGSQVLFSLVFGLVEPGYLCDWPDTHMRDIRPLAKDSRETMRYRNRRRR